MYGSGPDTGRTGRTAEACHKMEQWYTTQVANKASQGRATVVLNTMLAGLL